MIISPDSKDFSTVLHVLGRLIVGLTLCMALPFFWALFSKETAPFYDFLISISLSGSIGILLMIFFPIRKEMVWMHTFFIVSSGWVVASLLGAVPLYLSAHYGCFLDAWFEAMSGFATTGLTLVKDLDHISLSPNLWRHLMMFLGGQGIILASLSLISQAKGSVLGFYLGEARTEKILPNIIATARFIWRVSLSYLILGVTFLSAFLVNKGVNFIKAFFHAVCIFFASFDTGGFAPQSQNITYYHSGFLEIITVVLMVLGAINFNLHFWLWFKDKREIYKNFEIRTFCVSFFSLLIILFLALRNLPGLALFRKGFYQLISAHTGCGFTNLSGQELNAFGSLALLSIIFAMMVGGGVCSTTGGFKLMRLGVIFKSFFIETRRWMMPPKAVYKSVYHHLQDLILEDRRIKEAFIFAGLFLITYMGGAVAGMVYGYPALSSLFESVSATANVGLSMGITSPSMPAGLKVIYILQMWLGRLEFLAIFVSFGFIASLFKR
ncbi:MAG: potassium transporter TrkG [Candidatus Omnitrophota bacterium]